MNKLSHVVENSYLLTSNGYFYIEDLEGNHTIWDGFMWKDVIITKNDINFHKNVYYEVILSNGSNIICFHEQKLNIVKDIKSNIYFDTPLYEIKENALIYKFDLPEIEGDIKYDLKYPYELGYLVGFIYNITIISDFTKANENTLIMNKDDIDNMLNIINNPKKININDILDEYLKNIIIPINATKENKLLWLSGVIDMTASLTKLKDAIYLNISLNSESILTQIRYLCNTLGMSPILKETKETRKIFTNNIDKNEYTNIYYTLVFNANDTNKLFLTNMYNIKTYIFKYDKSIYSLDQDINKYISIKKINKITKRLTTYKISNAYSCIINGTIM